MNITTCKKLIKRELYEMRPTIYWLTITVLLILFFVTLSVGSINEVQGIRPITEFTYCTLGIFIASFAFWEFKLPSDTRHFLLLPATILEKAITKILVYILGWLLLFVVCWIVASIASIFIAMIFAMNIDYSSALINSILRTLALILPTALLLQSLTIFASCYFKRSVLVKLGLISILIILPLKNILDTEITNLLNMKHFIVSPLVLVYLALAGKLAVTCIMWLLIGLRIRETEAR